ncbi:MAG: FkbM family methyltransferase [Lachnospiraceae bacterium]|nr:FkbM family methyltransferase [Lachnospiraceae bacterium]
MENKDILTRTYDALRASSNPIYIYGAGIMSTKVEKRLKEQGIEIKGFFVDPEYYVPETSVGQKAIFSLDDLKNRQEKIDVVMGNGHYENRDKLSELPFINQVFIIANPYLQYCSKGIREWIDANHAVYTDIMERLADDQSRSALHSYCMVNETNDIEHLMNKDFMINNIFDFEGLQLTDHERFLDVGAWIGDTIDYFQQRTGNQYEHIYAVEPDPESFETLKENVKNHKNISLYSCGLGESAGEFFLDIDDEVRQSTRLSKEKTKKDQMSIKVQTLDELFAGESISLIKIFVPMIFPEVLRGGKKYFLKNKPRIIVGLSLENGTGFLETIKWLMDLDAGYKIALRFDMPMPARLWLFAY